MADENAVPSEGVVIPNRGQKPSTHWPNNSRLAADHVAAGSFESALRILKDTIGVNNAEPLKPVFAEAYARCVHGVLGTFALSVVHNTFGTSG